jgi:hypothetical protein
MCEDQLTLGMFSALNVLPHVGKEEGLVILPLVSISSSSFPTISFEKTRVYDGDRLVGWISPLHTKVLECCKNMAYRGMMKFSLLDLSIEFESLYPGDKYLETTLAARLRELCQWKLVQREDEKSRKGVYIYNGGRR